MRNFPSNTSASLIQRILSWRSQVQLSAVFLVWTHRHPWHRHSTNVHLSNMATAAIHVHHTVRCRITLMAELLLWERTAPGHAPRRPALHLRRLVHWCCLRMLHHRILGRSNSWCHHWIGRAWYSTICRVRLLTYSLQDKEKFPSVTMT